MAGPNIPNAPNAPNAPGVLRTPPGEALIPEEWLAIEGLACGFGSRSLEPPGHTLLLERQVHGARVVDAACCAGPHVRDAGDALARVPAEADALVTAKPGLVVGVRTADCVPLLLVAPRERWAAAVHAGWRGTVAGIAGEAVRAAREAGVRPEHLQVALGPSIGPCCYEVSPELGAEFGRSGLPVHAGPSGSRRPHLDLRAANRVLLERSGVPERNIREVGPCTRCAVDRYHSFRAEPGSAGRQVSWIGWAAREDRTRFAGRARPR